MRKPETLIKESLLYDRNSRYFKSNNSDYKKFSETNDPIQLALVQSIGKKPEILNAPYSKFILPAVLISYGVITRRSKALQSLDHSIHNEVNEHLNVSIPVDNYTQFAPAAAIYGLDLAGIRAKHNFRNRTIVMASSYMIMGAVVQTLKSTANVWRPDGSNNNSFPSGHTATAFVGAHILFMEYKDTSPWIGVAGYAVAAGTGALRVLNRKHWVSDVVTGAGIGILSAQAGYMLLPALCNILVVSEKGSSLAVVPAIGVNNYGIGVSYTFQ
ncbi:MAG: phosphatase PAP2 family protein [Tannerella sp.]|nr:phosphatase PAP2 family protein [Tannerella sp.]